jgi:hypothetical protein
MMALVMEKSSGGREKSASSRSSPSPSIFEFLEKAVATDGWTD